VAPETLAILLILASGAIHAVVNALVKAGRSAMAGRAVADGASAIILLPALAFVPLPHGAWGWLALSTAVHVVYINALVRAYQAADFTLAYPVARGIAPLAGAFGAVLLLDARLSGWGLIGVLLVSGGLLANVIGQSVPRDALGWSVLTGLLIAVYTVIDAAGVNAAPSATSYIVWMFVLIGFSIAVVFLAQGGRPLLDQMRAQWRPGLVAGLLSIFSYGAALTAFRLGNPAQLVPLRETGIIVATLLAIFWLKERPSPRQLVGIGAVTAGAMLLLSAA
jgi:drug/metabolite transporter (DMT)-like permease